MKDQTINRMQLISNLQTEVVEQLTKWQIAYTLRNDGAKVAKIEEMQKVILLCSQLLQSDMMEMAMVHATARKLERRYLDALERIEELEKMIAQESYFIQQ